MIFKPGTVVFTTGTAIIAGAAACQKKSGIVVKMGAQTAATATDASAKVSTTGASLAIGPVGLTVIGIVVLAYEIPEDTIMDNGVSPIVEDNILGIDYNSYI